jgi:hypothetical protein
MGPQLSTGVCKEPWPFVLGSTGFLAHRHEWELGAIPSCDLMVLYRGGHLVQ